MTTTQSTGSTQGSDPIVEIRSTRETAEKSEDVSPQDAPAAPGQDPDSERV